MPAPSSPFAHFVGFDWAKQRHHAVILDPAGQIVAEFGFEHTQAGWQQWRQQAARGLGRRESAGVLPSFRSALGRLTPRTWLWLTALTSHR